MVCAVLVLLLCVACALLKHSCGLDLKVRSANIQNSAQLDLVEVAAETSDCDIQPFRVWTCDHSRRSS